MALSRSMACRGCGRVFKSDSPLTTHEKKFCDKFKQKMKEESEKRAARMAERRKAGTCEPVAYWKDSEEEEAARQKKAREDLMTGELPPLALPQSHSATHGPLDEQGICKGCTSVPYYAIKAQRRRKVLKARAEAAAAAAAAAGPSISKESAPTSVNTTDADGAPQNVGHEDQGMQSNDTCVTRESGDEAGVKPSTYFDFDNIAFNYEVELDFSNFTEPSDFALMSWALEPFIANAAAQHFSGAVTGHWTDLNGGSNGPSRLFSDFNSCEVDSSTVAVPVGYTSPTLPVTASLYGPLFDIETSGVDSSAPRSVATSDYPIFDVALQAPPVSSTQYCFSQPYPLDLMDLDRMDSPYLPMSAPSHVAAMPAGLHAPSGYWAGQSPAGGYAA
ncbi:hypothetical protein DFP72DRAFT_870819 [Ephemerocybe angulata]|uniref:Uncharacterized protein n=1 Tax=Ephemerocybe angulata TaxID=980116 RepID=A0A8H6IFN9_9AGAR|nr:hypothetical protein DFP72DRAFT_870819 [Tulosesus angulatus]